MADQELKKDYERMMEQFDDLIAGVKAEGNISRDLPTAWASIVLDALIYSSYLGVQDGRLAKRDAPDLVIRTLFKGLS